MWTPEYAYARINLVKLDLEGNVIWSKKYGPSKPVNLITNIIHLWLVKIFNISASSRLVVLL
jgi:hypothetical protein